MGLFDFLRKKKSSIQKSISEKDLPYHKESGIYHSSADPETYIVVYEYGHVFRIFPDPGGSYHDKIGMILDARYIVSSGVHYDLNNVESVNSIQVPEYHLHGENQRDKELGVISSLEYLLKEKYHHFSIGDNTEVSIACLTKATQLMAYSDEKWELSSFYEVVDVLKAHKRYREANEWQKWLDENVKPAKLEEKKHQPLSYSDKERIMVERVTAKDVLQFTDMPYNLNCPLEKHLELNSHAFAYMNLTDENAAIAKVELQKLNAVIDFARKEIPVIPNWARINLSRIAFKEYNKGYGYTRLICTPLTYSGRVNKIPLSLLFLSERTQSGLGYEVNGEIKYFANGEIASATVNCWNRRSWEKAAADGWLYVLYNNNGNLTMSKILSTIRPDEYGRPTPIYKCPELMEEERQRERDYKTYDWLKENLPDLCPKSASSFRAMKTKNTKNYQKIVEEAEKLGYVIK